MSRVNDLRNSYLAAIVADLVGPAAGEQERLAARPSDRYLTGILFPPQDEAVNAEITAEDDDSRDGPDVDSGPDDPVPMNGVRRPCSMGISFQIDGDAILLEGSAARYLRRWMADGAVVETDLGRANECWVREPVAFSNTIHLTRDGLHPPVPATDGLRWWIRSIRTGTTRQVTVVLENCRRQVPGRVALEEGSFFQTRFSVRPGSGKFVPRGSSVARIDTEAAATNLIYRDVKEWCAGHVCAGTWGEDGQRLETTWVPVQHVPSMSADGHVLFQDLARKATTEQGGPFNASRLGSADDQDLVTCLEVIPAAYGAWIDAQEKRITGLPIPLQGQAREHLDTALKAVARMRSAIDLIRREPSVRRSFQLGQRAMAQQRRWEKPHEDELTWRPFQIGFQLLAIPGIAAHPGVAEGLPERLMMDLLWFPTGGGKTEAYLAIIAFLLFHRRLRGPDPDRGAGVAAIMRYTLRLLTTQQFERAARVVLACDLIRRESGDLGGIPFSIGLWVGAEATPNTLEKARSDEQGRKRARQLVRCPACQKRSLIWDARPQEGYLVVCTSAGCPTGGHPLPVFTIDEIIYQERPSVLIGTVDKFAQIVRNRQTVDLLGAGCEPPDLIVQDELHLISGPLGTVVGLYETAIDQICSRTGRPPKVIGSTATIRRAEDQVRNLFGRAVSQFPPPGLDWQDSGFAVRDEGSPGRLYAGITTAGRSPKFTLQAVCAAALQRTELSEGIFQDDAERDPYWTLVAYFNSMRELGGALVMMLDDVNDSMGVYARSHAGATPRTRIDEPLELTSRVGSEEIPDILARLAEPLPSQDVSVVLATNMISVGVDISRLGLMVMNGQPKGMAEYIQATSRVGRGAVPGLILTVYNAGRPRDRAHFEAFRTWHQALYREVEATSVTPFAPRARDKALHATVVALARHLVPGMANDAVLSTQRRDDLEQLVGKLYRRAQECDPAESDELLAQAQAFLDEWERRGADLEYWNDHAPSRSLLVSAEKAAEARAARGRWGHAARSTPNSMREVEPSVTFRLTSGLATNAEGAAGGPDGVQED